MSWRSWFNNDYNLLTFLIHNPSSIYSHGCSICGLVLQIPEFGSIFWILWPRLKLSSEDKSANDQCEWIVSHHRSCYFGDNFWAENRFINAVVILCLPSLVLLFSTQLFLLLLISSPCLSTWTSLFLSVVPCFVLTPSTSQLIKLPYIPLIMSMYAEKCLDEKIYESTVISKVCAHTRFFFSTFEVEYYPAAPKYVHGSFKFTVYEPNRRRLNWYRSFF